MKNKSFFCWAPGEYFLINWGKARNERIIIPQWFCNKERSNTLGCLLCSVSSSSLWWDPTIYVHVEFQLFLYLHEEALFHFDLLWIAGQYQYSVWLWSCLYIFCSYIWLYLTDCIDFFKMLIFGFLTPTMFEQPKKIAVKVKNFLHLNSTFNPQDHHQIKVSCLYFEN